MSATKRLPTIDELEKILSSNESLSIVIKPDGSIEAVPKGTGCITDSQRLDWLELNIRVNADNIAKWNLDTFKAESFRKLIDAHILKGAQPLHSPGEVRCPICGNYYGGHATGGDDICDCHMKKSSY